MRCAVMLLSWVLAASAPAQEIEPTSGRKIKYKDRTEITFEGLDVVGTPVTPEFVYVAEVSRPRFNPLIRLREAFEAEMNASVDEVK